MREPPPDTLFVGFGDSALNFLLRAWTSRFERWIVIKSELTIGVNAALRDAGISIPFPQRDLHIHTIAPESGLPLAGDARQLSLSANTGQETATDTKK